MKISITVMFVFLAFALGVPSTLTYAAGPAPSGPLPSEFNIPMDGLTKEMSSIKSDFAKEVLRILEKSGVEKDGDAYVRRVQLFGKEATLFFMYGKNELGWPVPVIAVMVPIDLTTKNLFGDSAPDLGLRNPLLCFAMDECTLSLTAMPASKQQMMSFIMPGTILAAKGVNLYGTLATGAIEILNPPKDPFVGVAKGKGMSITGKGLSGPGQGLSAPGQGIYVVSVSINPRESWKTPFGLANTEMTGGTIRITKEGVMKTIEAWGTAKIESKNFTMYFKQDTLSQSLGFDAKTASLEDFFRILKVAGNTLGLPKLPSVSLPLNKVTLENPVYQEHKDGSAPLNFETMMFKGTREAKKGPIGELITHAKGTIFGQQVTQINLNASATGVTGDAAVNAKLGPLEAGSANFYLNVGLTTTPQPKMGLLVKSAIFGDLDLKASTTGFELSVPANCPLRPIGFKAHITNLALTDFPIEPVFADCYTALIEGVVNGSVAVASDAGEAVASGAVETANFLGNEATKTYETLRVKRVAAWGPALATHAADVRSAKDAVQAADQAVNAAGTLVSQLGKDIGQLDGTIRDISNDINKLLKKMWSFVSGKVKEKKGEKAQRESERDQKRTEQVSAEQQKKQAEAVRAEANTALKEIPGPNLTGPVAELNQQMLGVRAQQVVQAHVATYATSLANDLKNPGKRKEILSGVDTKAFIDERKTQFTTDYPTLTKLMEKDNSTGKTQMEQFVDASKNALVVKVVSQKIEKETERKLRETVPTLPTMAFDVPVNVVFGEGVGNTHCLQAPPLTESTSVIRLDAMQQCTGEPNQVFRFRAGGDLVAGNACMKFLLNRKPMPVPGEKSSSRDMVYLMKDCKDDMDPEMAEYFYPATKFFFDPTEGNLIAYFANPGNNGRVACITADWGEWSFRHECGPTVTIAGYTFTATRWHLVPVGQAKSTQATRVQAIKASGAKPSAVPPPTTNLAPLQLR